MQLDCRTQLKAEVEEKKQNHLNVLMPTQYAGKTCLSSLLSAAPLEIIKLPSSTPFPKLGIPSQVHQTKCSFSPHSQVQSPWLSGL